MTMHCLTFLLLFSLFYGAKSHNIEVNRMRSGDYITWPNMDCLQINAKLVQDKCFCNGVFYRNNKEITCLKNRESQVQRKSGRQQKASPTKWQFLTTTYKTKPLNLITSKNLTLSLPWLLPNYDVTIYRHVYNLNRKNELMDSKLLTTKHCKNKLKSCKLVFKWAKAQSPDGELFEVRYKLSSSVEEENIFIKVAGKISYDIAYENVNQIQSLQQQQNISSNNDNIEYKYAVFGLTGFCSVLVFISIAAIIYLVKHRRNARNCENDKSKAPPYSISTENKLEEKQCLSQVHITDNTYKASSKHKRLGSMYEQTIIENEYATLEEVPKTMSLDQHNSFTSPPKASLKDQVKLDEPVVKVDDESDYISPSAINERDIYAKLGLAQR